MFVIFLLASVCSYGGRGVLTLSAHSSWPLKDLQFWVVWMEGLDPEGPLQEQLSSTVVTFVQKLHHIVKVKKNFSPVLLVLQGIFSLALR